MKALTIVFLITLQLALQIGIPIHKHFCEMDGSFASVFVKIDHKCAAPHTDLPPCCQKEQQKDDCCSDEIEVVKTTLDQINPSSEAFCFETNTFIANLPKVFDFKFVVTASTPQRHSTHCKRPPPLWRSGRQIQTRHQTWQI
ncbi:MAG: HYC_CC_PP family protein [Flavobacteriales bacterium]